MRKLPTNQQDNGSERIHQALPELDFTSQKVTGMFEGLSYNVPLSGFGDLGEYDAIMDWENDIAKELRELPRFSHS
ncbi:MAG: hypothetical protein R3E76_17055 [Planctomycetota bacterium]